tara:strand:+ start:237 stop:362 length:126 start_codon:yes stop_codon:yes gene_type:complete
MRRKDQIQFQLLVEPEDGQLVKLSEKLTRKLGLEESKKGIF